MSELMQRGVSESGSQGGPCNGSDEDPDFAETTVQDWTLRRHTDRLEILKTGGTDGRGIGYSWERLGIGIRNIVA